MLSNTNPTTAPKSTILHITSYALKGPPLDFEPDVHINARRLINPPSQLRKAFDGRCEGLRKNLRADPAFHELLTEAQPRIFEAEEKRRAQIINAEDPSVRMVEVNAAVACVRGRHRSAAVAEELAKLPAWPEHYEVRVRHRDVDNPHRYQKWHQQNLEREQKGEMVDLEHSGIGSEISDDEDSYDSESTSEEDRRRSEVEPRSTAWWEDCRSEVSRVSSKDLLKPENSTDPRNPLHIPSGEHGGSPTSQTMEHHHTVSEKPEHSFTTHAQALQHPSSDRPGPAVAQMHSTQHHSSERPQKPFDTHTQALQHTSPDKHEAPTPAQLHFVQQIPPEKHEAPIAAQLQTVQQIPPAKPVEIQVAPQHSSSDKPQGTTEVHTQIPQHLPTEKSVEPAITQTAQQTSTEKSDHPVDSQSQVPPPTAVVKPEAPAITQTQAAQSTEPEKHEAPAVAQTQPAQPPMELEKHEVPAVIQTQTAPPMISDRPEQILNPQVQPDSQHGSQ